MSASSYMEHCLAESCTGQIQLDAGTLILLGWAFIYSVEVNNFRSGVVFIPMYLLAKMRGLKGIILMCAVSTHKLKIMGSQRRTLVTMDVVVIGDHNQEGPIESGRLLETYLW